MARRGRAARVDGRPPRRPSPSVTIPPALPPPRPHRAPPPGAVQQSWPPSWRANHRTWAEAAAASGRDARGRRPVVPALARRPALYFTPAKRRRRWRRSKGGHGAGDGGEGGWRGGRRECAARAGRLRGRRRGGGQHQRGARDGGAHGWIEGKEGRREWSDGARARDLPSLHSLPAALAAMAHRNKTQQERIDEATLRIDAPIVGSGEREKGGGAIRGREARLLAARRWRRCGASNTKPLRGLDRIPARAGARRRANDAALFPPSFPGFIQHPPQRPFERPLQVQPPTCAVSEEGGVGGRAGAKRAAADRPPPARSHLLSPIHQHIDFPDEYRNVPGLAPGGGARPPPPGAAPAPPRANGAPGRGPAPGRGGAGGRGAPGGGRGGGGAPPAARPAYHAPPPHVLRCVAARGGGGATAPARRPERVRGSCRGARADPADPLHLSPARRRRRRAPRGRRPLRLPPPPSTWTA